MTVLSKVPYRLLVEELFELATDQLGCTSGVLSQHAFPGTENEIVATFHLTEVLAKATAQLVQRTAMADHRSLNAARPLCIEAAIESDCLPEGEVCGWRVTFVCWIGPTTFLALTLCGFGSEGTASCGLTPRPMQGWIEAHLRLLHQIRDDGMRTQVLTQALDQFDFGTFILDCDGSIIFSNERASQLLEAGESFCRAGQCLTASEIDNAVRLQAAIQHLSRSNHLDQPSGGEAMLMLIRRAGRRPLMAILARLSGIELTDRSPMALYVVDPELDTQHIALAVGRAYGLTATEAGLAIRLVTGLTIASAAKEMRIKTQTARAYLKQIFAKTDTHRQSDLVRVILGGILRIRTSSITAPNGYANTFRHSTLREIPDRNWG